VTAGLIARVGASRWARTTLRCGLVIATVLLLLLLIRRSGGRLGRRLQRLNAMEKTGDVQREMLEAATRRPRHRGELARRLRDGRYDRAVMATCPPGKQAAPAA